LAQADAASEEKMNKRFDKGLSQMYVVKDSAYIHFEKASKMANALGDYDSFLGVLDHIVITADYHDDIAKYQATLQRMDSLLSVNKTREKVADFNYWETAYSGKLGILYFKTKEYAKAKNIFLKIIADWKGTSPEELGNNEANMLYGINGCLGTIYRYQGKYELAKQYYLSNIALVEVHDLFAAYRESYRTGVQQMLGQLYTTMGEYDKATDYYQKNLKWSKEFYGKDKKYRNNLTNAYERITLSYIAQDSLQKALFYLNQSRPYLLADDPFYKDALILYGDIYSGLNEKQKALNSYKEALDAYTEFRGSGPHQDVAEIHGKIAKFYLEQKNYQEGLKTIRQAFNTAGSDIQIADLDHNPGPDEVFSKTQLLHLLDVKLQLQQESFQTAGEITYLESALKTNKDILRTFDRLKSEFDSKFDKQFLAEKAYPVFHRMLAVTHTAYEKEPSSETVQLALNIAEKNKDFVLLEALRNGQATQYGNVPQDVLDREAQLRTEITLVEKQIFDATDGESDFSNALFELKREYYGFLDTIKTKYPKYHDLKYRTDSLDLATVRAKLLKDDGTLVSLTLTDDYLYSIVLNGSESRFSKEPFSEGDRDAVRDYYKLLSRPAIEGSTEAISDLGKSLYDKILKKPLEGFDTENLTVIPDDVLHYLPFDLLRKNGSYLLQTTDIGYGNSVVSLLELKDKTSGQQNKVLAFAPSFTGVVAASTDRQFGKLLHNDDEVAQIGTFYDTETVLDGLATLTSFRDKSTEFNILHLATHASANDEYPDYSYLAFTKARNSAQGNILYIKDLYNISLNADLVTLSACQTGIGKLQKGQGMLSLSKGFYYAGAKSLVNTLWKINDKSTVKLMDYFYEGLSEGKSKTEALRNAKLKYLETTDDDLLRHPYYWAAFVVSGDVSPITKTNYRWYIGAGVLFFVILFFFSRRKSRIREFRKIVLKAS